MKSLTKTRSVIRERTGMMGQLSAGDIEKLGSFEDWPVRRLTLHCYGTA